MVETTAKEIVEEIHAGMARSDSAMPEDVILYSNDWHRAEGSCRKCNLKGFTKVKTSLMDEQFQPTVCNCLYKTLRKKGIGADAEFKLTHIEHVETMIARRKPKAKPAVDTSYEAPVSAV